jgi:hypothetical protein
MRLARDTDREIVTTMRGKRYTTSIEGTLTGLGGNLVIIDDPLKQDDAHSEAVRKRPSGAIGRQNTGTLRHCKGSGAQGH